MHNCTYEELANRILEADTILIFPHIHVDGDALGSSSALCLALRELGKEAYVYMSEEEAHNLDFLAGDWRILEQDKFENGYDLALMVDCSTMDRIKYREDDFNAGRVKGVIDHHAMSAINIDFDFGRIEPDSAAVGEMIYFLIKALGVEISLQMANMLWTAITTDTGNFQHANTTVRSHEIAADLHKISGFDSKKVSALIYNRKSLASLKLESMMIESVKLAADGEIAIGVVTQRMLAETGTDLTETDGFISKITSIDGVEIACLIKEPESADVVRVSLRAKSYANVARVALKFEGGGHIKAAGGTLKKPIEDAVSRIEELLIEELSLAKEELNA